MQIFAFHVAQYLQGNVYAQTNGATHLMHHPTRSPQSLVHTQMAHVDAANDKVFTTPSPQVRCNEPVLFRRFARMR